MDNNYINVVQHINDYFKEHLPQYSIFEVRKQSYDPQNDYLYMVAAKKDDGSFAIWTSWNESIQSLNWGHYNLPNMEACIKVLEEYQNGSLYAGESNTPLKCLQELLIKRDDNFEDSYHQLLYVTGFVDGITAQQKYNWNNLTEKDRTTLYAEAVKE